MKLKRAKRGLRLPLCSMSDVAFLLLIFIMLAALINYRKEAPVEYPEAKAAPRATAERNLDIWVDRGGAVYLNGEGASRAELEETIAALYRSGVGTRVHIIADRNTPYENINAVLEILQLLQYRAVSFAVRNVE